MFENCSSLTSLDSSSWARFPGADNGDSWGYEFKGCTSLVSLDARAWNHRRKGDGKRYSMVASEMCLGCTSLESACFIDAYKLSGSNVFKNCSSLECLIWLIKDNQYTTAGFSTGSLDPFIGSKIADGTGYVYMNDSKVNTFKAASGWSTYANQIKPISECPQQYLTLYNIDPADYQ